MEPDLARLRELDATFYLDELAELTRNGFETIRRAKKYGATPDDVIAAICKGAEQDPKGIPMLARIAISRGIANV
jgi:hypothetical protein